MICLVSFPDAVKIRLGRRKQRLPQRAFVGLVGDRAAEGLVPDRDRRNAGDAVRDSSAVVCLDRARETAAFQRRVADVARILVYPARRVPSIRP
jgi:hypothetical protein